MGKSEKQMDKEQERNQRIIDTAFRLFVEKKIEAVSMDEVAKEAGVGRATLFQHGYNNKTELAIAVAHRNGRLIWTSWMRQDQSLRYTIFRPSEDLSLRWTVISACIRTIRICCSIMTTSTII